MAHVDVEQPIAVHVGEGDAGGPAVVLGDARRIRDVAEMKLAQVQVDPRTAFVRREHDLGQAVTGEVADRDAPAVVVVAIPEDVVVACFVKTILKPHTGITRRQQREQLPVRGRR